MSPGSEVLCRESCVQRRKAVRNEVVSSLAVAEPEKRSQDNPISGSSEKFIAIAVCGLTKNERIMVRSVSPICVTDIEDDTLGVSNTMRSQVSLPLAPAILADVVTVPSRPCTPLAATVLISVAGAAALREEADGWTPRGIGAEAATILARSTGEEAGGA